jgi:hypothetical protein
MNIGITCQQNFGHNINSHWLEAQIRYELQRFEVTEAYSCLATSVDCMFANIILKQKLPLVAIIPSTDETQSLHGDQDHVEELKEQAAQQIQLPPAPEEDPQTAIYEAGELMVEKVDVLLAVWNSLPERGFGGTADIVAYAKTLHKTIVQINPANRSIKVLKKWNA